MMQRVSKGKWCFHSPPKPEYKPEKSELVKRLSPLEYRVTQEKATERPFSGKYLKLKDNGMYSCIICGEELFSSKTKFDSGCGWPAFYDVIDGKKVRMAPDLSHVGSNLLLLAIKPDMVRTEVTCAKCGSHLGHLFNDGPKPTAKRYCINSCALKFNEKSGNVGENVMNGCQNKDSNDKSMEKSLKSISEKVSSREEKKEDGEKVSMKNVRKEFKPRIKIPASNNTFSSNIAFLRSHLKPIKDSSSTQEPMETDL